jgi:hypothetical protein
MGNSFAFQSRVTTLARCCLDINKKLLHEAALKCRSSVTTSCHEGIWRVRNESAESAEFATSSFGVKELLSLALISLFMNSCDRLRDNCSP